MNRARAITVSFTSQPVLTIQTEPPNLRFKLDGNEILAPQVQTAGYITLGQNHTLSASAQQDCRTLCTAGTRYLFQDFADSAALTRTINWDGKSNVTYTLRFRTQHQQTFVSQNSTRGAVSVEARPADDYYDEGSTVKLTATPAAGNRFVSWQNGLLSTDLAASVTASVVSSCGNPWLFAVTQPLTLYGSFAAPVSPAPKPALLANGVVNTASGQGLAVSPGAILALYGTDLGPAALKAVTPGDAGYFDNCAAGTSVTFDGIPAPMIYASIASNRSEPRPLGSGFPMGGSIVIIR